MTTGAGAPGAGVGGGAGAGGGSDEVRDIQRVRDVVQEVSGVA